MDLTCRPNWTSNSTGTFSSFAKKKVELKPVKIVEAIIKTKPTKHF